MESDKNIAPLGAVTPGEANAFNDLEYITLDQKLQALFDLIGSDTSLNPDQARTLIYFAIATYGLPNLEKFPVMAIFGPAGTGKTTILQILRAVASKPATIDGKVSKAVLRDSLTENSTALIDEADDIHEQWLVNRYSRQSASTVVNQQTQEGWLKMQTNLFGATALHRRIPFKDPAILSRSIVLRTKSKKGGVGTYSPEDFYPYAAVLQSISEKVDWENVAERGGDRISDTWAPLLEIDALFGGEWSSTYAAKEIEKAQANLNLGQQEEPTLAVFQALVSIAMSDDGEVKERVPLGNITQVVRESQELDSWQTGQLVRDMGFETKTAGGKQYVFIGGKEKLVAVANDLGIEDEWLDGDVDAEEAA